ncbi:DUF3343 domain-containing protein [Sedimentibacter sp. zth1]|uniref:DUF3343 domain-containing protein n=1 Tax=Sedimentibacter sp. zth1 TaxID=2816908 RepID=UPI001A92E9BE|nr:DUF3343 domain-containing protein [Sedimentibacter sp. zth1]QSX06119.1 DUF3343 domain-containing protein [Sedimentibacter sp. zth1]
MNNYCLMTFKSITFVMQFEKLMKTNNMEVKIIPVPRSISTSCGMCGKFDMSIKNNIMKICRNNNVNYDNVYEYN